MKNILVIYFTQTGQAKQALDAVLKPFNNPEKFNIHFELIQPEVPFSYPWKYSEFMDAFPENVHGIPCQLKPLTLNKSINYDFIIIAYQPWFLSVCRPINSFLLSEDAKALLKDKPVVTVINCRNMWISAQEKMKQHLKNLNANLVGNMVFPDRTGNITSLITVLAFELKGVKEKFMGFFPRYGITTNDLKAGEIVGEELKSAVESGNYHNLQQTIVNKGLADVKPNLMIMEGRGKALFPLYANYISKKGTSGSKERQTRVKIFGIVLPTVIFLASPIITIIARLVPLIASSKMKKQIAYYQHNSQKSK